MKRSKSLGTLVIVILVLSITITSVLAQGEVPQVGELDEDGDLIIGVVPPLGEVGGEEMMPQLPAQSDDVIGDAFYPYPISPVSFEWVYDRTPVFKFAELTGATKYKIEVWNIYTDSLVYTFKGDPNCKAGICKLVPLTALKNYDITQTKGWYKWRVKAKIGGAWQTMYSDFDYFYVLSTGFVSTFTTDAKKWLQLYGDWFVTSTGYLKTKGVPGYYSSVVHKETFNDSYIYYAFEVKMKRKVTPSLVSNRIIVAGTPGINPEYGWFQGYEFLYYDDGQYQLVRRTDGVVEDVLCSGTNPAIINAYDWNKVTIWKNYPWLTAWINGTYVCDVIISEDPVVYMGGHVGIMEFGTPDNAFLVDKARVWLSPGWPYALQLVNGVRVEVGVPEEGTQPGAEGLTP